MKSIKLLAALAIPAMFAACTNEEIVTESPKQFNQVVGAELIGTDISMKLTNGASSRMGATGWEATDKLGLGWIVNGTYDSKQDVNKAPDCNKWFANHMFYVENNKFITRGNVYKGWHFAYYPFTYREQIAEMTWDVNPPQTSKEWASGRVNDALCISPLKFLSRESLDDNYQLKKEVAFNVVRAVNSIHVYTTAADQFAGTGSLSDLDVKSITLSMAGGKNYPFCNTVKMNVMNLPKETDEVISQDAMMNSFYAGTTPVFTKTNIASITTNVEAAGFKVNEATKLITLTAPYAGGDLDINNLSMEVVAGSGTFKINYIADAEEGTNAYTNNQALIALKEALAKGAALTKVNEKVELDIVLYADIFKTDFLHISDLKEWKDAVDMVTKLGRTKEVFAVDGVIEFNEGNIPMPNDCQITVNQTEGASGEVGLKITKKNIQNWPAGLTSNVKVINEKTINNATGINGLMIENKGTLKGITGMIESEVVNNGGTITLTKTGELTNVNNEGGRITVLYGSKVTTKTGTNEGIIAYTIAGNETAFKLNNLMGETAGLAESAKVNTFVVNSGRTLDLGLTDPNGAGQSDPYITIPRATGAKLASLADINIELNGGEIVGAEGNNAVKNVIMNGGIVNGVNINGTLTAESGTVTSETIFGNVDAKNTTITAETINNNVFAENTTITAETITGIVTLKGESTINNAEITGDVTVETGTCNLNGVKISGELTIKAGASVVLNSQNTIAVGSIVSSGELTANNDIIVENITLNPTSTTTLTDGSDAPEIPYNKVIYYKTSYNDGNGVLKGRVTKYGDGTVEDGKATAFSQQGLTDALANPTVTEVKLSSGEYSMPTTNGDVKITGNVGTVITIDKPKANNVTLNGVTVQGSGNYTGIQHSKKVVYENCVVKGTQFLYAEEVELKNCTIDLTEKADYIWTYGAKNVKFDNCIFNTKGKAILIYSETNTLVTNVTVKNCTFNATESAQASGATAAAIEIDSSLSGNGHYTLTTENNTVDSDFSGEWRIKKSGKDNTTVNGVVYNAITIDGVAQ